MRKMSNNNGICKYVWYCDKDKSRNPYGAFRRKFEIKSTSLVKKAIINVFADTVYSVYVNGTFVGFGPVRFDPRYPQYDTYDLTEHLQDGFNVISILANFHGHKVFKSIPTQAAMIAWGEVDLGDMSIDLSTGANENWKCKQHDGYNRFTPKLSFALFAQTHFDQGMFDDNWLNADYDDSNWQPAVVLSDQDIFGTLSPREIPFMELSAIAPTTVSITPIQQNEDIYSFCLPLPMGYDTAFDVQGDFSRLIYWSTYIYSPHDQHVSAGVFYDEVWLNGEFCDKMEDPIRPLRYNTVLPLTQGWNYLFVSSRAHSDIYNGYISLPKNKGLLLSIDKDVNSKNLFRHLPIQPSALQKDLDSLKLPLAHDYDVSNFGGWVYTTSSDIAQDPCREASWDNFAPRIQTITPSDISGFVVKKDLYPDGFNLVFDMDHMRLVFPVFQLTGGLEGATIDLVYSDRYAPDNQHLYTVSWVPMGDRVVCSGESINWQPIQPRGFRYISVSIRGATSDIKIDNIKFLSAHYPVTQIGMFECSDPLLNRIWEAGALTQRINMEDTYTDCVDRERGLYALDLLIQYNINLVCYGDQALMKRALEIYGQSNHEIGLFRCLYPNTGDYILPDFCLYIINSFYAYYKHTNDTDLITQYWSEIMKNIHTFNRLSDDRDDKLMCADAPDKDWPKSQKNNLTGFIGDGNHVDRTGTNCMYSCLYLISLREVLEMAKAVSVDDVHELSKRIAILETSIPEMFWNEEKGLFADTSSHDRFSPHASLFAINAGVVSSMQRVHLVKNVPALFKPFFINGLDSSQGMRFETSHGYYLFTALYELGLDDVVESVIKEGWGYFLNLGHKTIPEHFVTGHSLCHAWAAHPTYVLSRYVLGVDFDALSDEITVNPMPGTVTWAKGVVPHPRGHVEVEWHTENDQIIIDRKDLVIRG